MSQWRQTGKVRFIFSFGGLLSLPIIINYYGLKLLIGLLVTSVDWSYTLPEFLGVLVTSIFVGVCLGIYVQSKRRMTG